MTQSARSLFVLGTTANEDLDDMLAGYLFERLGVKVVLYPDPARQLDFAQLPAAVLLIERPDVSGASLARQLRAASRDLQIFACGDLPLELMGEARDSADIGGVFSIGLDNDRLIETLQNALS